PFNFPGHLPNGHIVPALLAGDTVVFKPSEETPLVGQLMAEAFAAADLPEGVVNVVQGGRETGAALLDAGIDALMFTGSGAAGAEAVAGIVVQSAFITTGQRCSCARRLIVPEGPQGDAVVEAVTALSDRLVFGRWNDDPEPYAGPLISQKAAEAALKALQE